MPPKKRKAEEEAAAAEAQEAPLAELPFSIDMAYMEELRQDLETIQSNAHFENIVTDAPVGIATAQAEVRLLPDPSWISLGCSPAVLL